MGLYGAKSLLRTHEPKLFVEVHPKLLGKNIQRVLTLLLKSGYSSCLFIDRIFEHPLIPPSLQMKRYQFITIKELINRSKKMLLPFTFSIMAGLSV
jgi:hypothetical protein